MQRGWVFSIDVGGTFTDCVADAPDGRRVQTKVLSGPDSPVIAIRRVLGLRDGEPVGAVDIGLATTRGTNALLERKGADVALFVTEGFGDLLEIGTQARPELFKLDIRKPQPLVKRIVEVAERMTADGQVLQSLNKDAVKDQLEDIRQSGVASLAVCLLHAYVNDAHERAVGEMARSMGFEHVSISSELTRTIKALDRAETAVVDAYLSPVVRSYLDRLREALPEARIKVMTSAGAMVDESIYAGRDSLLSGPAGGVVGCAAVAAEAGFDRAIGIDMGGTSTDVSRYAGRHTFRYSGEVAGTRVVTPMLDIETVAAGGGSICGYDGQRLTVGPDSAGADPGPACYGRGGPLTVTDINLFNGRIDPGHFPIPLDVDAVRRRLENLAATPGLDASPRELADGFTRVANLKMASAIRQVSSARGHDPADHALVAFGGAAAQHACAIARSLRIDKIVLHPLAGVLSAYGIGVADVRRFAEQSVLRALTPETLTDLRPAFAEQARRLKSEVIAEGIDRDRVDSPLMLLDLRYAGQQTSITVASPDDGGWEAEYERAHRRLYGYAQPGRAIEIAAMRVEVTGRRAKPTQAQVEPIDRVPEPRGTTRVFFDGVALDTPWHHRDDLRPGDRLAGPAIVYEALSTIAIDPGWSGRVTAQGDLLLEDGAASDNVVDAQRADVAATDRDPIRLELYNNRFTHIATQMGVTLQRTSISVNVKERLDFSCAVLDAEGGLVVNAPHIPVHLGAMSATVRGLIEHVDDLRPGDAYLTNAPDLGGSHLPDLTIMTPVFDPAGRELRFFTASRAHHAEIGGRHPGSISPTARCLADEGVVFRHFRLCRDGELDEAALRDALASARYPSRAPDDNVADLRAALAANTLGAAELAELIEQQTWPVVHAYMRHIRDAAEAKVVVAIAALPDGRTEIADQLDDGSPIRLALVVSGDRLTLDFTGTAPPRPDPINANPAIVEAAALYCLRCLIDEDIPLNAGVLRPVELVLPESMLNPPALADPTRHVPVAGGNVELSQRVVDLVLGALGRLAASQGTMNNFVFGGDTYGYYETICGGAGAGPTFHGCSAVQTHMTNTRLTDVEILERQYPVRVRRFAIRRGSGGQGKHRGGDGITRSIEFLDAVDVSLLTERRVHRPFGVAGGKPGQPGSNLLRRAGDAADTELPSLAQLDVNPGDILTIHTPGGGGYGKA
ncbi:MAG: hydantoinase B/oxoprolinase family protein [Planctomycetota bacterium]